jgi:hypothetical protein
MGLNNKLLERNLSKLIDGPYEVYAELSNYLKTNVTKFLSTEELSGLSSLMYHLYKKLNDYCSLDFVYKGFLVSESCFHYLNATIFAREVAYRIPDLDWIDKWLANYEITEKYGDMKNYYEASYRCYDIYKEEGNESALKKGLGLCKKAVEFYFNNFDESYEKNLYLNVMNLINFHEELYELGLDNELLKTNYKLAKKASKLMTDTKRKSDLFKQAGYFGFLYGKKNNDSELRKKGSKLLSKGSKLLKQAHG